MVAKSYQTLEIVGEPYTSKGRQYVQVRTKNNILKQVRWYSEAEYYKMYPEDKKLATGHQTQKELLGFANGYITIFKGNTYEDKEYFQMNSARYARPWGWYFISTEPLPNDIPDDITPVKLPWEAVGNEDGTCKPEEEMKKAVETVLYADEDDPSEFVGEVGMTIEFFGTVEKVIDLAGMYGPQRMHIFRDACDNCYVWTTAARSWGVGTQHHLRAQVKQHKTYRGVNQTIITRAREV